MNISENKISPLSPGEASNTAGHTALSFSTISLYYYYYYYIILSRYIPNLIAYFYFYCFILPLKFQLL